MAVNCSVCAGSCARASSTLSHAELSLQLHVRAFLTQLAGDINQWPALTSEGSETTPFLQSTLDNFLSPTANYLLPFIESQKQQQQNSILIHLNCCCVCGKHSVLWQTHVFEESICLDFLLHQLSLICSSPLGMFTLYGNSPPCSEFLVEYIQEKGKAVLYHHGTLNTSLGQYSLYLQTCCLDTVHNCRESEPGKGW